MTRLLFVTGVSCAGKTTLGRELKRYPDDVGPVWDIDEDALGRPRTAHLDWLRWRACELLVSATEQARPDDGHLVVITGIVWPFRVIESPAWAAAAKNPDLAVEWLMLDPSWKTLRRRLDDRTVDKPKSERAELRAYNRELRRVIRPQVEQLRDGYTYTKSHQNNLARKLITDEGWT